MIPILAFPLKKGDRLTRINKRTGEQQFGTVVSQRAYSAGSFYNVCWDYVKGSQPCDVTRADYELVEKEQSQ